MQPLVSIIVPIYKVEKYIVQCAESLFLQDWPNKELIFVDNNTPDRSIQLLEDLLDSKYPHCKPFVHIISQKKQGLGYAREAGLRIATGEYVIHVDSDDWVEHDFISKLAQKAVESNADVVYCNYIKEYEDQQPEVTPQKDMSGCSDREMITAIHNRWIQGYMWNKLIRRSFYRMDELVVPLCNMHEDITFLTQILYGVQRVVFLPEALYHYRLLRKDSITAMKWADWRRNSAEGFFHLYRQLPKHNSPLDYCAQDLLMRATWYALSTRSFSLLHRYPEVMRYIAGISYVKGRRVPVIKQRIMKHYCRIYLRLHSKEQPE